MEFTFEQLVVALNITPVSSDVLHQIKRLLGQPSNKPYHALLALEQWAWQLLSEESHQWIDQTGYQELFETLASFNKNLIFVDQHIEADDKAAILFPVTVDQIDRILKEIDNTTDDNDPYITLVSLWFDNHSYFINDNPHCTVLPITDHINQYIIHTYTMNEQYKLYLTELQKSSVIFTARMLFYIKTCSFSSYTYMDIRLHSFPCMPDEILRYIGDDYLRIIHIHSRAVASWNKELLACIAHLIAYIERSWWWDGQKRTQLEILFPTDQIACDHVQDIINMIAHEPFQKQIKPVGLNDETVLVKSIMGLMWSIIKTEKINWFFRTNPSVQNVISTVAEMSPHDELCVCAYGLLGEVLADEQLKKLKIAGTINGFFFNMLERAWHHPSKKYKIPIEYLLRGYLNLAKHDYIQQRTADLNKIPLMLEISEQYPIVYDILWALSFNQDIQQQLRANSNFMSKLFHLGKEQDNEQMRKITHGLLWNLTIHHDDGSNMETNEEKLFDIMISYSHKNQEFCRQLYEELVKLGHRVWIDFDQIHGNIMDAMAQAIERSETVIICISEDYRKSSYCRAEAHYAFQRQRKIVPVLLQKHYKPDGWLLFLIGQLLYVDFTKHEFNRAMKMLQKELCASEMSETESLPASQKEEIQMPSLVVPLSARRASILPILPQNMLDWTPVDVQRWLVGNKFIQMARLLADCDGRSLVYLNKYMKHSEIRHLLNSFREDSLRRLNENLSYIELSRFQTLLDKQQSDS